MTTATDLVNELGDRRLRRRWRRITGRTGLIRRAHRACRVPGADLRRAIRAALGAGKAWRRPSAAATHDKPAPAAWSSWWWTDRSRALPPGCAGRVTTTARPTASGSSAPARAARRDGPGLSPTPACNMHIAHQWRRSHASVAIEAVGRVALRRTPRPRPPAHAAALPDGRRGAVPPDGQRWACAPTCSPTTSDYWGDAALRAHHGARPRQPTWTPAHRAGAGGRAAGDPFRCPDHAARAVVHRLVRRQPPTPRQGPACWANPSGSAWTRRCTPSRWARPIRLHMDHLSGYRSKCGKYADFCVLEDDPTGGRPAGRLKDVARAGARVGGRAAGLKAQGA